MASGYPDGDRQRQSGSGQRGEAPGDSGGMRDQVEHAAGAAVEQGRHFLGAAKAQALTLAEQRKNDMAQTVSGLANSVRESGRAFEDRPQIRSLVDGAAQGLEQVADSIQNRSVADLVNDIEAMVRRQPVLVAAATLAAGFLVARFVRSSAEGMRGFDQPGGRSDATRRRQQPMQSRTQSPTRDEARA
ncbi:MAG TPA: hypothetical protein VHN20_09030 [Beijerinckiaceae bacterium]|nr:hypothetical protein [Beijerinckiaceae bacterium]